MLSVIATAALHNLLIETHDSEYVRADEIAKVHGGRPKCNYRPRTCDTAYRKNNATVDYNIAEKWREDLAEDMWRKYIRMYPQQRAAANPEMRQLIGKDSI